MSNNELKVGIVGLGKMGLLHASILNSTPNVKVSAICETKRLIARFARKVFDGITVVDKIHEFSNLNLDAIFISTPIPSHLSVINSVYSIGIYNVFTEKTLAANGEESLRICQLAQKVSGVNMVGYMARFAVTFQRAKVLLDAGAIGETLSFKGYAYSSDFIGIPENSVLRGGVVRDLGCHVIDLAMWYFGDLEILTALLEPCEPVNGESIASFKVKSAKEVAGEFDVSWCKPGYRIPEYGLVINGKNGSIEVNNDSIKLINGDKEETWYRVDLSDNVPFLLGASEYYREDANFIDAIINKSPAEPDFVMASKVDCFIDKAKLLATGGLDNA